MVVTGERLEKGNGNRWLQLVGEPWIEPTRA